MLEYSELVLGPFEILTNLGLDPLLQRTPSDHQAGRGVHGGTQGEDLPGPDEGDGSTRVSNTCSSTPCMFAR